MVGFGSFTSSPCTGQSVSPSLLTYLTLRCLSFYFQWLKLKIELEKQHQFLVFCRISFFIASLLQSMFTHFTVIPCLIFLVVRFVSKLCKQHRSAAPWFTNSSGQEMMFSPKCSVFPATKGHL